MKKRSNGIRWKKTPVSLPAFIPNRWKALNSHHLSTFLRTDIIWDYAGRLEYNIYNKKQVFLKRQWELSAWYFWVATPGFLNFLHCDPWNKAKSFKEAPEGWGEWLLDIQLQQLTLQNGSIAVGPGVNVLKPGSPDTHTLVIWSLSCSTKNSILNFNPES